MIIVIGNTKGGPGKSTCAQNITVGLMKRGKSVYLVDADPQGSTADWIEDRRENKELSKIRFSQMTGKIRNELLDLEKEFDVIIVDCGGHDSDTLRYALTAATHVLIPVRPKRRDLKELPVMDEILELIRPSNPDMKVLSVMNQCPTLPSQAYRILDAKDTCSSYDLNPLNSIISNRNIFDDADESGSSVFEMNQDKKAIEEVESVITEVLEA